MAIKMQWTFLWYTFRNQNADRIITVSMTALKLKSNMLIICFVATYLHSSVYYFFYYSDWL
jgi:hypothetical protein